MKDLYFIRHGQTEWNAIRRMQGQWNSDLSENGREHARVNGEFLKHLDIDYMIASPLDRTRQTADIIDSFLKLGYGVDDRIMEWDCGDWSGEMWDGLTDKWPTEFASWQADQFNYRAPGGENYPDMIDRARPFLKELLERPFNKMAVVSHGMIGRVMIGILLDMSTDEILTFSQTNETVIHLTGSEGNFTRSHYVGGGEAIQGLPPRIY